MRARASLPLRAYLAEGLGVVLSDLHEDELLSGVHGSSGGGDNGDHPVLGAGVEGLVGVGDLDGGVRLPLKAANGRAAAAEDAADEIIGDEEDEFRLKVIGHVVVSGGGALGREIGSGFGVHLWGWVGGWGVSDVHEGLIMCVCFTTVFHDSVSRQHICISQFHVVTSAFALVCSCALAPPPLNSK